MSNTSGLEHEKVESSIPKWFTFGLLFVTTLVFASLIKAYLLLLMSGITMLFIWTQLTKEKADIIKSEYHENDNQLSLFNKNNRIGKKYSKRQMLSTEPSGQRRRYLKTLDEEERGAA